ncbi:MAG: ATP-binding protein [Calditrichaceae bacterium]|jgi:anti-sigma regulatory factor (Ser/Thr protein kinase)
MNDLIRFHVPCKLQYTKLVEDVTDLISAHTSFSGSQQFMQKLRAVMNEVFINIVKHSDTAKQNEMVRFQYELGLHYFTISIYDYGPGFDAEGYVPPYPKKMIGTKHKLRDVLDGSVHFTITDPFSVSFTFEEKDDVNLDDLDGFEGIEENGMGISIVTKLMDSVTYSYIGQGKYDWKLIKEIN